VRVDLVDFVDDRDEVCAAFGRGRALRVVVVFFEVVVVLFEAVVAASAVVATRAARASSVTICFIAVLQCASVRAARGLCRIAGGAIRAGTHRLSEDDGHSITLSVHMDGLPFEPPAHE
jgi:hypothetical protein